VPITGAVQTGAAASCAPTLRVANVPASTPYWTPRRDAARYDFEPGVPFGLPFRPTPFHATFALTIGGAEVNVERNVEFRYSDLFAGEKRMELQVVPAFDVRMSPTIAVVAAVKNEAEAEEEREMGEQAERAERGVRAAPRRPVVRAQPRTVTVTVKNNMTAAINATASVEAPAGWTVTPASAPLKFERTDEEATASFKVTPKARIGEGDFELRAVVSAGSAVSRDGYEVVEYPHIQRRQIINPLAKRREMDPNDGEPLVKVGAEATGSDQRLEVAVGGGDDPEVHLAPFVFAEPADDVILEDAEQLDLRLERRVVDLVEEDAAAGRGHQLAVVGLHRAREGAARVAKEFRLHQLVRDRRAVDRHEAAGAAR